MATLALRLQGCLFGLFVGDAVAMPVHWYYDVGRLRRDYPPAGGGGRGGNDGRIIGDVINHGKRHLWERGANNHYHVTLKAGENTLEADLVRVLMRTWPSVEGYRQSYMEFMTTPGSHNDTYASTCHRMFFANRERGVPPKDCPDNDGHNVDTIDALTPVPPVVVSGLIRGLSLKDIIAECVEAIGVTRRSSVVPHYTMLYVSMLHSVLQGTALQSAAEATGRAIGMDVAASARSSRDPMVACYLDSSFPALIHFVYKYGKEVDDAVATGKDARSAVAAALLKSANAGGENVARGAILGALLGARAGMGVFGPGYWMRDGLVKSGGILEDVNKFLGPEHASSL